MALKTKKPAKPLKSKDVPATYGALDLFRNELKGDISSARVDIKSFEKSVNSKFTSLEMRIYESSEKALIIKGKVDMLDTKIVSMREDMHARFEVVDKKLAGVSSDMAHMRKDMGIMSTQIDQIKSSLDQTNSKIDRVLALVEEQNSRNRYVLDGYSTMYESHKTLESRINKLETGT
jgi:chromosome segregation ATPase